MIKEVFKMHMDENTIILIVYNLLSPNIHIQILLTDPHTFSYSINWEKLKGPVEKGRKWWFEVKIEIAPI